MNSLNTFTGDNSTVEYSITFPYFDELHIQVLVDNVPHVTDGVKMEDDRDEHAKLRNGPQVNQNKTDVVAGQDQVDDLLDDLGF